MSVRFRLVNMFDAVVRKRLPTECQKYRTRCGLSGRGSASRTRRRPRRRASGPSSRRTRCGSYSRSASCTITYGARRLREAAPQRRALAQVDRLERRRRTRGSSILARIVARAVGRPVVDDDQLGGVGRLEHLLDDRHDGLVLVVAGHDDRQSPVSVCERRLNPSGKRSPALRGPSGKRRLRRSTNRYTARPTTVTKLTATPARNDRGR